MPFWEDTIAPSVMAGNKVLVVAHENVLRGFVQKFSGMSNEQILKYNIPTATPFVYEFDFDLNPLRHYYVLGDDLDAADVRKMEEEVGMQGTVRHVDQELVEIEDFDPISAESQDPVSAAIIAHKRI